MQQSIMDVKKVQELVSNLHKCFKCPECFKPLHPSMTLCRNGHALCEVCRAELKKCPTCEEEFLPLKDNCFVNELYKNIPKLCPFEGCTMVEASESHKKTCGFRPTTCKVDGCQWGGCVNDLITHMQDQIKLEQDSWRKLNNLAPDEMWLGEVFPHTFLHGFKDMTATYTYDFKMNQDLQESTLFMSDKGFFWIQCFRNAATKIITYTLTFLPKEGNEKEEFFLIVSLNVGKSEFKCTFESVLDTAEEADIKNNTSGMVISDSKLKDVGFKKGAINVFKCEIIKK